MKNLLIVLGLASTLTSCKTASKKNSIDLKDVDHIKSVNENGTEEILNSVKVEEAEEVVASSELNEAIIDVRHDTVVKLQDGDKVYVILKNVKDDNLKTSLRDYVKTSLKSHGFKVVNKADKNNSDVYLKVSLNESNERYMPYSINLEFEKNLKGSLHKALNAKVKFNSNNINRDSGFFIEELFRNLTRYENIKNKKIDWKVE